MALQVIWLSDIGTRSKMEVRIQVWEGSELVESHYQWPMCTPTSTAGRLAIVEICCSNAWHWIGGGSYNAHEADGSLPQMVGILNPQLNTYGSKKSLTVVFIKLS